MNNIIPNNLEDDFYLEDIGGNKYWYKNNVLHREDGPAIDRVNGYKAWFINGKRHRLGGPAIEWDNGDKEWYYEDKYVNCHSQKDFKRIINLLCFA